MSIKYTFPYITSIGLIVILGLICINNIVLRRDAGLTIWMSMSLLVYIPLSLRELLELESK